MNTYNFEQEIVKLRGSMVAILAVRKPVYGDSKHHIETNQVVYVTNQLTGLVSIYN